MKKNRLHELVQSYDSNRDIVDVTIILNIWKRPHLPEQLFCLLTQTVLPKEIWIIHYENYVQVDAIVNTCKECFENIQVVNSTKNLKYFGRFSLAVNVTTDFVWIIDDDVIPGKNWLKKCAEKCVSLNSIISCTGRIIPKGNFEPERIDETIRKMCFIGDMEFISKNYCENDTKVDYACNSYFFRTAWLKAYWSVWPQTFLSGEDMHLSATCKTILDVDTYVLSQATEQDCGNLHKIYGCDDDATWRTSDFISLRRKILEYHILERNWKPILW